MNTIVFFIILFLMKSLWMYLYAFLPVLKFSSLSQFNFTIIYTNSQHNKILFFMTPGIF